MTTALDTETFLIYPGNLAPDLVCVSWAGYDSLNDEQGSGLYKHDDEYAKRFVSLEFEHRHTVFANAPFDLAVFMAKWPELIPVIFKALDEGRVHDVQTREKLLDLARGTFRFEEDEDGNVKAKGYSLFDITRRRLGKMLDKDTYRLNYHDRYDVPLKDWPEGARHYAISDAVVTLEIFEQQEKLKQYLGNEAAQVRAHTMLHLMSCHGFKTDPAAVKQLKERVVRDIDEVKGDLIEAGLVRKDGSRDTKAAVRRMMDTSVRVWTDAAEKILSGTHDKIEQMNPQELAEYADEKGKYISVAEEPCIMSGDKTLIAYSRYSKLQSLLTGSIKDLETGCTIPIQPRYEVIQATGRTGCSGPNLQNLRRAPGVRECFVPRDGKVIIACDYQAAELHTWAQVCYDLFGKSKLGDAMNKGIDPHTWLGARVVKTDYVDMDLDNPLHKAARNVGKAANFGFIGGCGVPRFVALAHGWGCDITEQEAALYKDLWMRSWDEAEDYFKFIRDCQIKGTKFFAVDQLRVQRVRGRCTYTSACNSLFQGLAADGAKAAGYEIARRQYTQPDSILYGTRLLAFVHDEYLLEAPEERAHEIAMEMQTVMEDEFNRFVPDCPTHAEPTIMRRWSKKAKQVRDDEGRLMPWEG